MLAAAGQVNPYTAFAMSDEPDGSVRVAFQFEDDGAARANADARARLAAGPAPGQGGTFRDRFTLDDVSAHGSLVAMQADAAARRLGALGPQHRAGAVRDLLSRVVRRVPAG